MDCNDSNNSFHYFDLKDDTWGEVEIERMNCSATYPSMFNRIFDNQSIKKLSLDLSDCEEQNLFVDKLNISEIKPLNNESKHIQLISNPNLANSLY